MEKTLEHGLIYGEWNEETGEYGFYDVKGKKI